MRWLRKKYLKIRCWWLGHSLLGRPECNHDYSETLARTIVWDECIRCRQIVYSASVHPEAHCAERECQVALLASQNRWLVRAGLAR